MLLITGLYILSCTVVALGNIRVASNSAETSFIERQLGRKDAPDQSGGTNVETTTGVVTTTGIWSTARIGASTGIGAGAGFRTSIPTAGSEASTRIGSKAEILMGTSSEPATGVGTISGVVTTVGYSVDTTVTLGTGATVGVGRQTTAKRNFEEAIEENDNIPDKLGAKKMVKPFLIGIIRDTHKIVKKPSGKYSRNISDQNITKRVADKFSVKVSKLPTELPPSEDAADVAEIIETGSEIKQIINDGIISLTPTNAAADIVTNGEGREFYQTRRHGGTMDETMGERDGEDSSSETRKDNGSSEATVVVGKNPEGLWSTANSEGLAKKAAGKLVVGMMAIDEKYSVGDTNDKILSDFLPMNVGSTKKYGVLKIASEAQTSSMAVKKSQIPTTAAARRPSANAMEKKITSKDCTGNRNQYHGERGRINVLCECGGFEIETADDDFKNDEYVNAGEDELSDSNVGDSDIHNYNNDVSNVGTKNTDDIGDEENMLYDSVTSHLSTTLDGTLPDGSNPYMMYESSNKRNSNNIKASNDENTNTGEQKSLRSQNKRVSYKQSVSRAVMDDKHLTVSQIPVQNSAKLLVVRSQRNDGPKTYRAKSRTIIKDDDDNSDGLKYDEEINDDDDDVESVSARYRRAVPNSMTGDDDGDDVEFGPAWMTDAVAPSSLTLDASRRGGSSSSSSSGSGGGATAKRRKISGRPRAGSGAGAGVGGGEEVGYSNEYRIKRKLLRLRRYDKSSRPVHNDTTTMTLYIGMSLYHILDTSQVLDRFKALFTEDGLRWLDEYLQWDPAEFGGLDQIWIPATYIWTPDIFINNFADDSFQDFLNTYAIVSSSGQILWMFPAVVKTYCTLDVRHFPFDDQKCNMVFISWTFNGHKLNVTYNESEHQAIYYTPKNQEWYVDRVTVERHERVYTCCPEPYPDVTFTIHMTRRSLFYVINLIFPCLLIYAVSFLGFFLPVESGEKVNLEITILLALVVFLLIVGETLPPTPDAIPALGILFGLTMFMVSIALVMAVVVTNIFLRKDTDTRVPACLRHIFLHKSYSVAKEFLKQNGGTVLRPPQRVDASMSPYPRREATTALAANTVVNMTNQPSFTVTDGDKIRDGDTDAVRPERYRGRGLVNLRVPVRDRLENIDSLSILSDMETSLMPASGTSSFRCIGKDEVMGVSNNRRGFGVRANKPYNNCSSVREAYNSIPCGGGVGVGVSGGGVGGGMFSGGRYIASAFASTSENKMATTGSSNAVTAEMCSSEWRVLAKSIDRLFFWVFVLSSVAALLAMFVSLPHHNFI